MKIARTLSIQSKKRTAIAVGYFDGVHLGHRAVIDDMLSFAKQGLETVVFSFETNGSAPSSKTGASLLQSPQQKINSLEALGVDWLLIPKFTLFMGLTPEQFAHDFLLGSLKAQVVCCGYDYKFGRGASAGPDELEELLAPANVQVRKISAVINDGNPISSTRIRAALSAGDIKTANRLLGRPFSIDFPVEKGRGFGKTLGFPTANQKIGDQYIKPLFGVYATRVTIDGKSYPAVTNVGIRPTVGSDSVLAETFIDGWSGDLYSKQIETQFIEFIRKEQQFPSIEELKKAIEHDYLTAMNLLSNFEK